MKISRLLFLLSTLLLLGSLTSAQQRLTAFPGAEGYGKFTSGGRGGTVYYVTRLDDCADNNLVEGTLRWALRTGDDSPRTVLFRVCGTIYLTNVLKIEHSNVTIAGQSAPGGGICIAGCKTYVSARNVIIRHIRFRAGDMPTNSFAALDVENAKNIIVDHCSMTWSMEECLTAYDTDSTTFQWCIIGEALYNSKNKKGERAYATQWGGEHSTMHHCLITNCYNRTPRFNGVRDEANLAIGNHAHDAFVDSEFANNVIYNWGKPNSLYGGENDTTKNHDAFGQPVGYCHVYMRNNYFRAGPTTLARKLSTRYFVQASKGGDFGHWYLDGNKFETGNKFNYTDKAVWQDAALQQVNDSNLLAFSPSGAHVLDEAYASSALNLQTADEAYADVCRFAGAQLPRLDEVDTRLLQEAAGTIDPQFAGATKPEWLGIIDSPADITLSQPDTTYVSAALFATITPYPYIGLLEGDTVPDDTDLDGIPDYWELAHNLNPNDPSDAQTCTLSALDGYTNLEFFLNGQDGELSDPIPAARPVPNDLNDSFSRVEAVPAGRKAINLLNGLIYLQIDNKTYSPTGQETK